MMAEENRLREMTRKKRGRQDGIGRKTKGVTQCKKDDKKGRVQAGKERERR